MAWRRSRRLIELLTASLLVQGLVCQRRSKIWRRDPGQLHSALIMPSWTRPSGTAPSPIVDPLVQSLQSLWHFEIMALAFRLPSFRFGSLHFISPHFSSPQFHGDLTFVPPYPGQPLVELRGQAQHEYWADC